MKSDQGNQANDSNNDRRKEARTNTSNGREQAKAYTASYQASSKERENTNFIDFRSESNMSKLNNPVILEHLEQGSEDWFTARRGVVTMSHAKELLTGGKGVTRDSYLMNVASEIVTGVTADTYKSWAMERGNILEPFARDAYEIVTGQKVKQVGFGYLNDDKTIGASPDGLGEDVGVEIKCQLAKNHVATLHNGINPKQFEAQMQGCMWIFGKAQWDYVSFCPECTDNPIFIYTVYRDESVISKLEESALRGVDEIKKIVASVAKKPVPAITNICDDALLLIETLSNKEPEIF